ncbi:O-antigen ligase family protein, partial [bacterium]|nr:O-antigen ligase family protein [bacterium]
ENPTAINRIPYSVHLSLAIFLLARLSANRYILPIIILMLINLFMQEGRTGQVAFFCLIILFAIQRYGARGILYGIIGILLLSTLAHSLFPPFERRTMTAISQFEQFKDGEIETSIGKRLYWWQKSLEIIRKNPIIGVGTGDFSIEYVKIDQENIPTDNPHNNYLLILVIFGIIGFLVFSNIFYQMIKYSLVLPNGKLIQMLVLAMLVYMFFDSPLMRHRMIFFTYLSGLLLKDEG